MFSFFVGFLCLTIPAQALKANITSKVQDKRQTDQQLRIVQIGNQRDYEAKNFGFHRQQQLAQQEVRVCYECLNYEIS